MPPVSILAVAKKLAPSLKPGHSKVDWHLCSVAPIHCTGWHGRFIGIGADLHFIIPGGRPSRQSIQVIYRSIIDAPTTMSDIMRANATKYFYSDLHALCCYLVHGFFITPGRFKWPKKLTVTHVIDPSPWRTVQNGLATGSADPTMAALPAPPHCTTRSHKSTQLARNTIFPAYWMVCGPGLSSNINLACCSPGMVILL
jgi:hypothetical protein